MPQAAKHDMTDLPDIVPASLAAAMTSAKFPTFAAPRASITLHTGSPAPCPTVLLQTKMDTAYLSQNASTLLLRIP